MKKKLHRGFTGLLGLAMAGAMLLTPVSGLILPEQESVVRAETQFGWVTEDGKTYYYDAAGSKKYLLESIGGFKYYFDR